MTDRLSSINPALSELRQALKDKFAEAHRDFTPRESIPCGVDWLDKQGGIPRGALCEISGNHQNTGDMAAGAVVIGQMLRYVLRKRERLVLIDGADSFDPSILPVLGHQGDSNHISDPDGSFLWARCRRVDEAVRVADLILRDGNLPRTVIDLQGHAFQEIRSVPSSSWLRLRSLTEDSGVTCVIMTPRPSIACAALRFEMQSRFTLDDLECPESIWADQNRGVSVKDRRREPESEMPMAG